MGKPGENVRSYAVFQEEKVVRYLRLWVDEGGDFGAMGDRGEWLRDQLNALIRAFPSNSHCTERAVQAAVDTSVPFATKTGEAVVSTGVTQTMERRRKQRESGQEARDAKVAAGEAKKAKATAKAAAKAAARAVETDGAVGGAAAGSGGAVAGGGAAAAMSVDGATEEEGTAAALREARAAARAAARDELEAAVAHAAVGWSRSKLDAALGRKREVR